MSYKIQTFPETGDVSPNQLHAYSSELWVDYELGFETEAIANARKEDLTFNGLSLVERAFNPCRIRVVPEL